MKINILHMVEGARNARGAAVIIDVFRAFTTECYMVRNNAERIIPVASKELAYELKERNPAYILAGERGGVKLPGFDYGNSPAQLEHADFSGKTIVHTTSAGTQGLENAVNAEVVLTGSLVNARAVAEFIKQGGFNEVSLVCMGLSAERRTEEDDLCAYYLKNLLENKEIDISAEIEGLKYTSGKKFFNPDQNEVFPMRDFELCTDVNKFDFVLKLEKEQSGGGYIKRINIK